MNRIFEVGNIVEIDLGPYRHVGIVSDRWSQGQQMVIENSKLTRRVQEVPLGTFAANYLVRDRGKPDRLPIEVVLERARSKIDSEYRLFTWNCEHLVSWAHGDEPKSPQVKAVVGIALGLGLLAGLVSLVSGSDVHWDANVGRMRGPDGRFVWHCRPSTGLTLREFAGRGSATAWGSR